MSLPQPRRVDSKIWQICAGPAVKIPKIGSKVYYFSEGHLEHACSSPNIETQLLLCLRPPSVLCIISSVDLLANLHTDEVFAQLLLTPVTTDGGVQIQEPAPPDFPDQEENDGNNLVVQAQEPAPPEVPDEEDDDSNNLVSYVKILTQSDTHSGLFVPRECMELIFPNLDLEDPMQSQKLSVTDIQDVVWTYKYSYHVKKLNSYKFTTGWSQFVRKKKLVALDSVVFIKNSAGKIYVGIRRKAMYPATEEEGGKSENFTEKAVKDAVELAAKNMAFQVVYYPTANWCDFVVDASVVDEAMNNGWEFGMGIKLCLNEDASSNSKKTYYQPKGTISNMSNVPSNVPSWRMLQVNWDGPDISQNPNRVNPWQVDIYPISSQSSSPLQMPHSYPPIPPPLLPFPPTKSPRLSQSSSPLQMPFSYPPTPPPLLQSSMSTSSFIPMTELPYSTIGSLNQTLLNSDTFPDGMLGASHDHLSASDLSKVLSDKGDGFNGNRSMVGWSGTLCNTEPRNHNSLNSFGTNEPCTK